MITYKWDDLHQSGLGGGGGGGRHLLGYGITVASVKSLNIRSHLCYCLKGETSRVIIRNDRLWDTTFYFFYRAASNTCKSDTWTIACPTRRWKCKPNLPGMISCKTQEARQWICQALLLNIFLYHFDKTRAEVKGKVESIFQSLTVLREKH